MDPLSKYKYAFGLLGDARSFIESAVELARQESQGQWKFSILHLVTALELLLKARLALEDHRHLISGNHEVSARQFAEGAFRSIDIDSCIKKLKKHCHFSLTAEQCSLLLRLRNLRNRIAHFSVQDDTADLKAAVGAGLNLYIEISNAAEFRDDDTYGTKSLQSLVAELRKFEGFVKGRLSAIAEQLRTAVRPRTHHADECPLCLQDAAVIQGDHIKCLFCGDQRPVSEFAKSISEDGTVQTCPDCGRQSVFMQRWKDRQPTQECFCCGHFTGPELKWSDGTKPIPRLHPDR